MQKLILQIVLLCLFLSISSSYGNIIEKNYTYIESGKAIEINGSKLLSDNGYVEMASNTLNTEGKNTIRVFFYVLKADFPNPESYTAFTLKPSKVYVVAETKLNGNYEAYSHAYVNPEVTSYIKGLVEFPVVGIETRVKFYAVDFAPDDVKFSYSIYCINCK